MAVVDDEREKTKQSVELALPELAVRRIISSKALSIPKLALQKLISKVYGNITFYDGPINRERFEHAQQLLKSPDVLQYLSELISMKMLVQNTKHLSGDIAEVGTFRGGSAQALCEFNKDERNIYLFDTFEGLPEYRKGDTGGALVEGDYAASLEDVKARLKKFKKVEFFKGRFPQDTGKYVKKRRFSLVHLDVDLYSSTYDSLEFFWPRMVEGGVILTHDYHLIDDVNRAFADFLKGKHTPIIELTGTQALIVKINNK